MADVDEVIRMLDDLSRSGVSRIKVETSDDMAEGAAKKSYHHGRCDVGSPFATGKLYDLEDSGKLAEEIQGILEKNPYIRFLGVEFLDLRDGYALAKMRYREELANHYGTLHGGSLYSLADIIAGAAACMGGFYVTTVSGVMNFLLPAKGSEYVFCEAIRLRGGKHLSVFEVRIKDEENRILDSGEFTFFVTAQAVLDTGTTKDAQE